MRVGGLEGWRGEKRFNCMVRSNPRTIQPSNPRCALMPKARVMVYTTLKDRLGFSRIELAGGTVRDLLRKLAVSGTEDVSGLMFEPSGAVRGHFVLTLNSEILDNRKTGAVKVRAGDVLHVFPPVSGG